MATLGIISIVGKVVSSIRRISIITASLATLLVALPLIAPGCDKEKSTQVTFKGKVVDQKTNRPVAAARVIVRLNRAGFMTDEALHYGVETDRGGRFELTAKAPFKLESVDLEAMSPSGKYGSAQYKDKNNDVVISTNRIPERLKSRNYVNYEHFVGEHKWGFLTDRIVFVGPGWEIRNRRQIESRYPDPRAEK